MGTHVKVRVWHVLFMQVSYTRHAPPTILWHVSFTLFIPANSTKHLRAITSVFTKESVYFTQKNLLFLFYTITFTKHQHKFIYYIHFFIKIIFSLTLFIISHLTPPNPYFLPLLLLFHTILISISSLSPPLFLLHLLLLFFFFFLRIFFLPLLYQPITSTPSTPFFFL